MEDSIRKKSMELHRQNQELSVEENMTLRKAEKIKAVRLKKRKRDSEYYKKRNAAVTLEEKEALKQKRADSQRRYRKNLLITRTPEELEAIRLKQNEKQKQRYREKLLISLTPEEFDGRRINKRKQERPYPENLESHRLKKIERVSKIRLKLKTKATPAEGEAQILKEAEKAKRCRQKLYATASPEEIKAMRLKNLEKATGFRQTRKEIDASGQKAFKSNRERSRRYREKKEFEDSILKRAIELPRQNRELSAEEKVILRQAEEIKAVRLKKKKIDAERYCQEKNASVSLEEKETLKLKRSEMQRQYRKKLLISRTPEELEALRLRINEKQKQRYRKKLLISLLPEEREARRLKKNEKERLYRMRCRLKADSKSVKTHSMKEQNKHHRQMILEKNKALTKEKLKMTQNITGWLKTQDQITLPLVVDEIKIENEVLQETTIKTILAPHNANQKGGFNDSSSSWLKLSEKNLMSKLGRNSENQKCLKSFYRGSPNTQESLTNSNSSRSTKLDRRKESFRCMRVLIDATSKLYEHAIFGKQIAQKLRTCKKDVAEVNIAKLLVDNILENLKAGVYNSEKTIA